MSHVQYGIAGWGTSARVFHVPLIQAAGGTVAAVVERRTDTATGILGQACKVCRSVEDLVALPHIDVIVVATPSGLHYEHAKLALEGGKHVVVEKPLAPTFLQAEELCDLARARGCVLTVFHNRRWDGDFLTVKRLIADGSIGRVMEFESRFDRFRPAPKGNWKEEAGPGTGLLNDLGSHLVDQAMQLFGPPSAVHAQLLRQRPGVASDDFFALTLEYEDRPWMRVSLRAGHWVRAGAPRFTVHGTEGTFIKYGLDPQEAALRRGDRPGAVPDFGEEASPSWGKLWRGDESGNEAGEEVRTATGAYSEFYTAVSQCVGGNGEPPVDPRSAALVIQALDAARESGARGAGKKL